MARPAPSEHNVYFGKYIGLVPEEDVIAVMTSEIVKTTAFLKSVPEDESTKLHAPYTWTFRQVLGHLIDTERIFAYRALRFARADTTPLPGYEENDYVKYGDFNRLLLSQLAEEYAIVRQATLLQFKNLPPEAWDRTGTANDAPMSVRSIAYIIAGHERHHCGIMRKRIGKN